LRERILTLLKQQKEEDRLSKSKAIGRILFERDEFRKSKTVLFYAPFDGEVDTFEIMKMALHIGKCVCLPKVNKLQKRFLPIVVEDLEHDLERGAYGIMEPRLEINAICPIEKIDSVIVPGLAFDRQNYRLGRGGGYYDRFLVELTSTQWTAGLAFDFQMVDTLPQIEPHDVPVSCVITN
jgi:5-formyltetrahydrofolate cyclo-ligase